MLVTRRQWLGSTLAVAALGCQPAKPKPATHTTTATDKPLRVLVVAAPEISAKIDRYWHAQSDAPLELSAASIAELSAMKRLAADVVLYPSELLGTLAEANHIVPLTSFFLDGEAFKRRDILNHARTTEVVWGERTFAVCTGSPTFVLYYRTDLFERLNLALPQTWSDYATACATLSDVSKLGDAVSTEHWSAVAEPLAKPWASKVLLARAAAYTRHRSEHAALFHLQTMEPLIQQPPFVKALEELVAVAKHAPANVAELTPTDTRKRIYAGHCAMAWSWPTSAVELTDTIAASQLGIAQLPGATEYYNARASRWETRESGATGHVPLLGVAGVLGSITTAARQPRAAETFLTWLSAGDDAVTIASSSAETTMFRDRQTDFPQAWCESVLPPAAVTQYVELIRRQNDQGLVLVSPRLPGYDEYLGALDAGIHAALVGRVSPREALQAVAVRFQEITVDRGLTAQRIAYQRSLGLDA